MCYNINVCILLVQCPPPISSNLICPNGATVGALGDTCTFSCKVGFNLQGSTNGTCLANQGWSGNPVCVARRGLYYTYISAYMW